MPAKKPAKKPTKKTAPTPARKSARQLATPPRPKFKLGQRVTVLWDAPWTATISNWMGAIAWDDYGHFYRYQVQQDSLDASGYPNGRQLWVNENDLAPLRPQHRSRPSPHGFGGRHRHGGAGDPHWVTAKFPGTCAKCHARIKRNDAVFYYPSDRSIYCDREDCGRQASRDFEAARADERFNGSDPGY